MAKKKSKGPEENDAPSTSKASSKETSNNAPESGIWQDSRFQHLLADPRFRALPKQQRKVKIDKRFQSMFTDSKFKVKYTVDKYGRRVNQSNTDDLKKYYELESGDSESEDQDAKKDVDQSGSVKSESEEEDIEAEQRMEEKAISREADDKVNNVDNDALESDGETVSKPLRERLFDPHIDYARGDGRLITDSSSDEESSEDEDDVAYIEHTWGELDAEAGRTDDSTRRLAVCNMDWDRIRAVDLLVLFNSFLPPGGSILNIKIYLSEFGKERLKVEEEHGPVELVGLGKEIKDGDLSSEEENSDDELSREQDSDAEEGDDYHMEKLRQYQLNRLRYYYAVVECDTVATADKIYAECDGLEYESSATRIDLRFVPDDTTFDDEPTDQCKELPDSNSYQPRMFTNTALQQAKVDLTWDETAYERRELSERLATGKLEDVKDQDLRKIVAYSSGEENETDSENEMPSTNSTLTEMSSTAKKTAEKKSKKSQKEDYISKYRALLTEIKEKEDEAKNKKKIEMEITWDIGENDKDGKECKDQKDLGEESKPNSELTPIEKVLKKRTEKNRQRKLERKRRKLIAKGLDPDDPANANSDSDSVPDAIDMNDPYFAEEFADGNFVDPNEKKREKKKKLLEKKALEDEEAQKEANELELLLDDDDEEQQGKQHFSLDKILKTEQETKSKRKRRKILKKTKTEIAAQSKEIEDNFKINLEDNRFKALYSSPLYNIDPTDSHFKKTKAMEEIIHEKLKRRHGVGLNGETAGAANKIRQPTEPELKKPRKLEQTLLVKSLKRKLQAHK